MKPLPGARLTVVNPGPTAPYTGMLPGHVAGHYPREAVEIDLVRLARAAGARLILDTACGVDADANVLMLENGPSVAFDVASLNVGITSFAPGPEFGGRVFGAKPMDAFADAWDAFLTRVRAGTAPEAAVIGGGVGGCELALAMAHRLRAENGRTPPRVTIVERSECLAPAAAPALRRALARALSAAEVTVRTGASPDGATDQGLRLPGGEIVPAGFIAAAAGAVPPAWLEDSGLTLEDGYVKVSPTLQSLSHPHVFAAGDVAAIQGAPRAKAGVYAVRAGRALNRNLRAVLCGDRPRPFRPQRDYLKIVSLGARRAVGEKWGVALEGGWAWSWKHAIDQRFMERLNHPPFMDMRGRPPRVAAEGVREIMQGAPPCGGCGSKAGRDLLSAALAGLPAPARPDMETGPGDDAAVLIDPGAEPARRRVLTTDHFRAFTLDPALLARIAAIHALGDIWAMGASPRAALCSIVLPDASAALQRRMLDEILAAAQPVLDAAGAALAGGHTSLGSEQTIGFTVLGEMNGRAPTRLDAARPGDRLVLTKPIGAGVILAGEMRGLARGRDWADAMHSLQASSAAAASVLAERAHAMTDVTGFGLAGHLAALCEASGCAAVLELDTVPLLNGALDLARAGVRSSIWPDNARVLADAAIDADLVGDPRVDLLADPQTAGGLLAAVPREELATVLEALSRTDTPGVVIGALTPAESPALTLRSAPRPG